MNFSKERKFKCKKRFDKFISKRMFTFYKGNWYPGFLERDGLIVAHSDEDRDVPAWELNEERFHKCFYSISELREMEIDKVLL
tara:strand:- start:127041 stop:127289 length:249 start_codon:yes stop_codon:yes gene_type:complete